MSSVPERNSGPSVCIRNASTEKVSHQESNNPSKIVVIALLVICALLMFSALSTGLGCIGLFVAGPVVGEALTYFAFATLCAVFGGAIWSQYARKKVE